MTIFELQHRFDQEVQKYGVIDPVPSTTVEDFINYAYQNYITEKYDSLVNRAEKFEITERISRILSPLLTDFTSTTFTSITTNSPYGYYVTAPDDLQYIIKEGLKINYTDCNGDAAIKTCNILPIKHNRISSNRKNPFVKPADDEVWRVNFSSNRIELILYEGVTPNTYSCRYLKKHKKVNFNPVAPETGEMEIDSSVHEEIVARAAYMYLGNISETKKTSEENA